MMGQGVVNSEKHLLIQVVSGVCAQHPKFYKYPFLFVGLLKSYGPEIHKRTLLPGAEEEGCGWEGRRKCRMQLGC